MFNGTEFTEVSTPAVHVILANNQRWTSLHPSFSLQKYRLATRCFLVISLFIPNICVIILSFWQISLLSCYKWRIGRGAKKGNRSEMMVICAIWMLTRIVRYAWALPGKTQLLDLLALKQSYQWTVSNHCITISCVFEKPLFAWPRLNHLVACLSFGVQDAFSILLYSKQVNKFDTHLCKSAF